MQARRVAVLLLEVTDFGWLKRDLGPAAGDELLRTVAERLHAQVPDPALLTRIRDAEFAIVFSDLDPEFSAEDLATRLLERVSEPCQVGGRVLSCKVIGAVRLAADRSESGHHLLECAAVALGRARVRNDPASAGRVAVAPPRPGRLARCEAGLGLGQSESGGPIADTADCPPSLPRRSHTSP